MPDHQHPRPLWKTGAALAVLFLADLGVAGQGLISIFVGVVGLVMLTGGAAWSALSGAGANARRKASRAGLYFLLAGASIAAVRFHQSTAEAHAAEVIAACRAYQTRHGALPDRLALLVPDLLPSVPRAKYTLQWSTFTYAASGNHTLMYTTLPPFGRRVYNFETGRWTQSD